MAGNPFDPPDASSKNPFDPPKEAANPFDPPAAASKKNPINAAIGGALTYGHEHPFQSLLNVMQTPQRALQAVETGGDVGRAVMHPGDEPALAKAVRDRTGVQGFEDANLPGNGLGAKLGRFGIDTTMDVLNDPMNLVPVGKLAEVVGKAVPAVGKVAEAAAHAPIWRDWSWDKLFNPEHDLHGLSEADKATVLQRLNQTKQQAQHLEKADHATVAQHAETIRKGQIPLEVKARFRDSANVPADGSSPQEVLAALGRDRSQVAREAYRRAIYAEPLPSVKDRAAIQQFGAPRGKSDNPALGFLQDMTHAGNKAFLALPFPHGGNLTNLSYNEYGAMPTLKGLRNAVRVATNTVGKGKMAQNIGEVEKIGAHSQYGNIFDEIGPSKVLGSSALGAAARPIVSNFGKASNKLQNKFLNPLETGLRAAALDVEKKRGGDDAEIARRMHRAFGSDEPNAVTAASSALGTPFAKFHGQTSVGSGLRTLGKTPQRISNASKMLTDYNADVNPSGPQFRMSVPGLNTARAIADPLAYFSTLLGPLAATKGDYSTLTLAQKGKVAEALSQALGRYVPLTEVAGLLANMAQHKKGDAGEDPTSDILPTIFGGYYVKPKR